VLLIGFVAAGIWIMAGVGYTQIDRVTARDAATRIDRAARAAAAVTSYAYQGTFAVNRNADGRPMSIHIVGGGSADEVLAASREYNLYVKEIASINQGAANVFRFNAATKGFDRFATTFRRPDGSMPPPLTMRAGHPAYASLAAGRPFVGEVPVQGRMRLAYMTPIFDATAELAGALAIDVGWVDDLYVAREELRGQILFWTSLILVLVASAGIAVMYFEMRPLRAMGRFADSIAEGTDDGQVPYLERKDEIGKLANGLLRVAKLQDSLETLAYFDPLTSIANRAKFLDDIRKAVTNALDGSAPCSIIMLDLDHFKETNDAYGHAAGDQLLQIVRDRVLLELAPEDQFYRLGGDDFAIVSLASFEPERTADLCERIGRAIAQPIMLPHGEARSGASMGIVLLPRDGKSVEEAYRNADLALRDAKSNGRNRFVFFNDELNAAVQHKMLLARMLRQAIEENALAVHFQPQVRAVDCTLHGVEALARWPHPERGFIPPYEFIPVAEASGLIGDLGAWILNESCRVARGWLDAKFDFGHVSVNVSPIQLWQPNFVESVAAVLARNNLPARYLCLEVTESVFVSGEDRVMQVLGALRSLGVTLSLDDFGSGYSSLGYLNKLPLDQLKIDRSFVRDVDHDLRRQSLLRGIAALGKGLGLHLVAEGAERKEEVEFLREYGCDAVQGFYFAKPVTALLVPIEADRVRREFGKPARAARRKSAKQAA
jgi:diguanylate cyclase (GGDEF)-like protein